MARGPKEAQKAKPAPATAKRAEPDLDMSEVYSVEYLAEAASGSAREERLAELKRRIALGAYKPDPDAIAEGMLARVEIADRSGDDPDSEDSD
jgi:anti-sigma28 factor (negative regulator of flagellin synthesis)